MAGKVWVVEKGCYSDYRVVGVFTSRKNAEKALTMENPTTEAIRGCEAGG